MSDKALTIVPRTLTEVTTMAEVFAKSGLLPEALRGKVPDVVVQIITGQEIGLSPMASIRGVHIVQGKPILSADTMVALALGSGLCDYFSCVEETATSVTYETKRKGSPIPQRVSWSDDDTKAAGLNLKDNWRMHKKQMRRARAKAILARDVYPDVLAGCYDPDEIAVPASQQAQTPAPTSRHDDVQDAELVSETPAPVADFPELAAIEAAKTPQELMAMLKTLQALPSDKRKIARERYHAKMAILESAPAEIVVELDPVVPAVEAAS